MIRLPYSPYPLGAEAFFIVGPEAIGAMADFATTSGITVDTPFGPLGRAAIVEDMRSWCQANGYIRPSSGS